jgi:RNA polymerase sigma factor (sigma-70 family)
MNAEAPPVAALEQRPTPLDPGAELIAQHLAGDPLAFGELMDLLGPPLFGYLLRSGLPRPEAEDLYQETFLRLHRSARRYDATRSARVWAFAIARNLVRSHFRKRKVRRIMTGLWRRAPGSDPHAGPLEIEAVDPAAGAEQIVGDRQQLARVSAALGDLPEGPRQALILCRLQGLSLEETAEVLGAPVATVKTWIRRGRLRLAEALDPEGEAS